MSKRSLILVNAVLWAFAAYKILGKGLPALYANHGIIVILPCLVIAAGFVMMFNKVSAKYVKRILQLEGERFPIWQFMSPKGYILITFMMTLGITLGRIPAIPEAFFAAFYPGLGSGLAFGAVKYIMAAIRS